MFATLSVSSAETTMFQMDVLSSALDGAHAGHRRRNDGGSDSDEEQVGDDDREDDHEDDDDGALFQMDTI